MLRQIISLVTEKLKEIKNVIENKSVREEQRTFSVFLVQKYSNKLFHLKFILLDMANILLVYLLKYQVRLKM